MKISDVISSAPTLVTPRDLEFYPLRVSSKSKILLVRKGTAVKYVVEPTTSRGSEFMLRLFLDKKVMGYKTYTWAASYDSVEEAIADGFNI